MSRFISKRATQTVAAAMLLVLHAASAWGQSSASSYTYATRYDAGRRVTGTIAPDPDGASGLKFAATRNSYDSAGRLIKTETGELSVWKSESIAPSAWGTDFSVFKSVEVSYDAFDRKVKEQVRAGSSGTIYGITQYSYDSAGRLQCTAVRLNSAAFGSLPSSACSLGTSGANGPDRITVNVYDIAGQLIQVRKAVGTPLEHADVTYAYWDASTSSIKPGYTPNGNQQYIIDANGNRAKFEYDGFDRKAKWIFSSAARAASFNGSTPASAVSTSGSENASDFEQYGYDNGGNRTALRKRDGRFICQKFDGLNRASAKFFLASSGTLSQCQSATPSGADAVYYGYDLRSLQTYARLGAAIPVSALSNCPSGATSYASAIINCYDGFARMTSSTNSMGGTARTIAYQYDANSNRTRLTYPDNNFITYGYDGLDRMRLISQGANSVIGTLVYNAHGERDCWLSSTIATCGTADANKTDYSYDDIGRVASINHDLAGTADDVTLCMGYMNGTSCTASYNTANQALVRTTTNNAYVWNGQVNVERTYATNGRNQYTAAGSTSFAYDANGNLTSDGSNIFVYDIENRLVSASGSVSATLAYDPLGRLYQTVGTTTTRFLYDGDELVGEYDGAGALLRRYVHGPNIDEPLFWYEGSDLSTRRVLRANHQASIVSVAASGGNSVGINTYDDYGIPGSGNLGRFAFTGQIRIPELGMYYYKARIYSPTLGRFLQVDPIGYDDQINLYAYVANDPINQVDATGTMTASSCQHYAGGCGVTEFTNVTAQARPGKPGTSLGEPGRGGDGRILSPTDNGGDPLEEPSDVVVVAQQIRTVLAAGRAGALGLAAYLIAYSPDAGESPQTMHRLDESNRHKSTGRTIPSQLAEQVAMRLARSHPDAGTVVPLRGGFKDPGFPAGTIKMRQNINGIEVHYVKLPNGSYADFKFP